MNLRDVEFDPVMGWPQWTVLAAVCAVFFAALGWRNATRLGAPRAALLTMLRTLGIMLLLLVLLRPARREELPEEKQNHVIIAGIDTSRSMEQPDAGNTRRIDAAVRLLQDAGLTDGRLPLHLFTFDEDARPLTIAKLSELKAEGTDTRIHASVLTMLQGIQRGESAGALVLFTDGHDFEMTSPAKTALAARSRGVPVYAVPLGSSGKVRDISLRIANYQPYSYVKQKCRISAVARFTGCENEFVTIQLFRNGTLTETRQLATREEAEIPIEFTVIEAAAGQAEYEVRALPVHGEKETANNSAITYVNVLDDKLRVLLIEGAPYWDTTFLQRSLMRNDKIDLDAVIQFAPGKARRIRKSPGQDEFALPSQRDEFNAYDVVLLGAKVGDLLNERQQAALVDYVSESAGVVVSTRGPTGLADSAAVVLEPVVWEAGAVQTGEFEVLREGRHAAPLQLLSSFRTDSRALPPLVSAFRVKENRTLAATLAETRDAATHASSPAFIHRPVGRGQVLAIGAGDVWQWAFHSDAAAREALFDRLWDQVIIWLLAGSDRVPGARDRLRASAANLPRGEELVLRLQFKKGTAPSSHPVIRIEGGDDAPAQVTMTPTQDPLSFEARHVPSRAGRYRAEVTMPDGSAQSARFMVFEENREVTEVAADRTYLKKLCDSTGGRLLEPPEFAPFLETLRMSLQPAEKHFRLVSLWDRPWVFYLLVSLFAFDWYLRRRWGLS